MTFSYVWLACSQNQERKAAGEVAPRQNESLPYVMPQRKTYMTYPTFVHAVVDFLNAIGQDEMPQPSFVDGVRCQAVLEAVSTSVETQRWVAALLRPRLWKNKTGDEIE